jgi:hypothetical protein
LNKKEFFASALIASFFALLLNIAIAINFGDDIAKVIGYFLTVTILPFILAIIPPSIILFITRVELSNKQKWWLFLWPCILVVIIYIYFFLMLTYGGPL